MLHALVMKMSNGSKRPLTLTDAGNFWEWNKGHHTGMHINASPSIFHNRKSMQTTDKCKGGMGGGGGLPPEK